MIIASEEINTILSYVTLAPSVHNTQPWKFIKHTSGFEIHISHERILKYGDPIKRELWLSIGACISTAQHVLDSLGYVYTLSTQTLKEHEAITIFTINEKSQRTDEYALELLRKRQSYRGRLLRSHIEEPGLLAKYFSKGDIEIKYLQNRQSINHIANLTKRGLQIAINDADFRSELGKLIHLKYSNAPIGMPGEALEKSYVSSLWEKASLKLGLQNNTKAILDKQRIMNSAGLLCFFTAGDTPPFWLKAGETYMSVCLALTDKGIAYSTHAAAVEAGDFHEEIEAMCSTHKRLQIILRVGIPQNPKKCFAVTRRTKRLGLHNLLQ